MYNTYLALPTYVYSTAVATCQHHVALCFCCTMCSVLHGIVTVCQSHGHTYGTHPAHLLLATLRRFTGAHAGGTTLFLHCAVIVVLRYVMTHSSVQQVLCLSSQGYYALSCQAGWCLMSQQTFKLAIPWNSTWRICRLSCAAHVKPCTPYDKATVLIVSVTCFVLLEWGLAQV